MADGQQHRAIEAAETSAGDGAIDEIPTAEMTAAPATPEGEDVTGASTAPRLPAVVMPRSTLDAPSRTHAAILARGFGPLLAALVAVCCFALVGVSYSVTVASGADWTRGAQVAAYVAFALALLALAVGALRYLAGRRALSMVVLALLLVATLAGTGAAGLVAAPSLHRGQARVLEQSGRYEAAITEYALAGDKAPNAPDTARTYDEWAASLLRQKQYAAALSRYLRVTSTYPGTGSPYHLAEAGIFATYTAWIAVNGNGVPYPDAIAYIQTYMQSAACDAACQSGAKAILPQAAYQFGTQLTAAGQYAEAVKQLAAVKVVYPQSPYAAQAHAAAAVAYLDLGQQQLPTACGDAVKTYQTLAKSYGDTPQGAQAKKSLDAPQSVTGTIAQVPSNPAPTIYLSRSADPVSYYFSNDFHTSVDIPSGVFKFTNVPLGTYFLSAVRDTADGSQTIWWNTPDGSIYTVQVGPLCGAQLPTVTYG